MSEKELQASNDLKGSLCNAAMLAHPNDEATICLFTDASDVGWGAIVTQEKDWDEDSSILDQFPPGPVGFGASHRPVPRELYLEPTALRLWPSAGHAQLDVSPRDLLSRRWHPAATALDVGS
ncbi:hypothetical protein DVH05_016863 [Phytophthora capsici]|nr:hypothetical protein DVH05_016863 [Phytophthora capsici]|eukprot:jgi/Phyca11/97037/e_gw1.1.1886.1